MIINHGIIAVEGNKILHFCGYEQPPTVHDFENLEQELKTDPEFGLTGIPFVLMQAPAELIEQFKYADKEDGDGE